MPIKAVHMTNDPLYEQVFSKSSHVEAMYDERLNVAAFRRVVYLHKGRATMRPKCKTCGAPVNLAPDGDPRYEAPRFPRPDPVQAVTLIERIYYMEGKDVEWRAARMNGVARDFQNGASLAWAERLFPRHNSEAD